jgi:2-amino-4-hydroxy-6-hydroxymethyldihydropteridine diphosphokinase
VSVRYGIGLGSSGPDARRFIARGLRALEEHEGWRVLATSRRFLTPAAGGVTLAPFVNAAVLVESCLSPRALLFALLALERRCGRLRGRRNAGRSLDLDVLWSDAPPVCLPALDIPHPRLRERSFALVPLLECLCHTGAPLPLALLEATRRLPKAALTPLSA